MRDKCVEAEHEQTRQSSIHALLLTAPWPRLIRPDNLKRLSASPRR
jgi:hypothetical protein